MTPRQLAKRIKRTGERIVLDTPRRIDMSVTIETLVNCDGCGENYWGDDRHLTAKQIRQDRRELGWVQRGSKDYCETCKIKYCKAKAAPED